MKRTAALALLAIAVVAPAGAQEASHDRAELDAAAGRTVHTASQARGPNAAGALAGGAVRAGPARDEPAPRPSRPVRVILSSPYNR